MGQRTRMLVGAAAVLLVLAVLAIVGIRGGRSSFTPPVLLKAQLGSVSIGHTHAFAARAGTNVVLFDTGPDPGGDGLDALLKALGASRGDVHDVFLTHGHGDHIAGAALFTQARVWAGADDVGMCAGTDEPEALMARVMGWIQRPPAVTVNHPLNTDESVDVGNNQMVRAIPMPGHTPGSYAYLFDGVLFVGDGMVLREGKLAAAPALFSPHPDQARDAVRALKEALGDTPLDRVCTAHGGCTDAGKGSEALVDFLATLQS